MTHLENSSALPGNLPHVVACVPAFQSEKCIARTLDSVLNQDYPHIRIFISVDLSEDNTLQLCRQYQQNHSQITLFQQSERQGWLNNTNFLFQKVEDPYFFYMQHDDVIQPHYVSSIMESLVNTPNAVLGYSDLTRHHYKLPEKTEHFRQMPSALNAKERVKLYLRSPYWYVVFRGIVSRDALQETGPLVKYGGNEFAADFVWLMKLAYQGNFVRIPLPLYDKFVMETSLAESWKKGMTKYVRMYVSASRAISALPLPVPEKSELICAAWMGFLGKIFSKLARRTTAH